MAFELVELAHIIFNTEGFEEAVLKNQMCMGGTTAEGALIKEIGAPRHIKKYLKSERGADLLVQQDSSKFGKIINLYRKQCSKLPLDNMDDREGMIKLFKPLLDIPGINKDILKKAKDQFREPAEKLAEKKDIEYVHDEYIDAVLKTVVCTEKKKKGKRVIILWQWVPEGYKGPFSKEPVNAQEPNDDGYKLLPHTQEGELRKRLMGKGVKEEHIDDLLEKGTDEIWIREKETMRLCKVAIVPVTVSPKHLDEKFHPCEAIQKEAAKQRANAMQGGARPIPEEQDQKTEEGRRRLMQRLINEQ